MAINFLSSSPQLLVHQSDSFRKPGIRMLSQTKIQLYGKKQVLFQIKSSLKNQVYEDGTNGIVCYKDENGEIICEGFDEGPRCHPSHQYPLLFPSSNWEMSIHEFVEKRWLQILDEKKSNGASWSLVEEQTCNEPNTFH